MLPTNRSPRKALLLGVAVLLASLIVITTTYHIATSHTVPLSSTSSPTAKSAAKQLPTATASSGSGSVQLTPHPPSPTGTPPYIVQNPNPATVLGVDSDPGTYYAGIHWVRLGYPTCGWGDLSGNHLKTTMRNYHNLGLHVLLIICQAAPSGPRLFAQQQFTDVAQSNADAVQCGNEEMKQNSLTTYVNPSDFARFYDLCSGAVHHLQPNTPVLLGALDPHVGGIDYGPLNYQASYLDQVQAAMNSQVHPGGNWSWRSQIVGLIDSWHNGYPNQNTNSLYWLFVFWAQQFHVDLNSGQLGKHLWVVEGTGCFKGCGIDPYSSYQVAVSHILTLVIDAQTTTRYNVPFFYFSSRDFIQSGEYWPIGILDLNGRPKPIRQDLSLGARVLSMSCSGGQVNVTTQVQLLAALYQRCSLPGNYLAILTN